MERAAGMIGEARASGILRSFSSGFIEEGWSLRIPFICSEKEKRVPNVALCYVAAICYVRAEEIRYSGEHVREMFVDTAIYIYIYFFFYITHTSIIIIFMQIH